MSITKNLLLNWYPPTEKNQKSSDDFWHRKLTLRVKSNFGTFWRLPNLIISFDRSWCLAKNLSSFVSLPWKLHNRYCHTVSSPQIFKNVQFTCNYFATLVLSYYICDKNENMSLLRNIIWISFFPEIDLFCKLQNICTKKSVTF